MKRMHILFTIIITVLFAQDFNPGPYGSKAFDFAGPFELTDLNRPSLGDPNFDGEANINDLVPSATLVQVRALAFNSNGLKMYVSNDGTNNAVHEFETIYEFKSVSI